MLLIDIFNEEIICQFKKTGDKYENRRCKIIFQIIILILMLPLLYIVIFEGFGFPSILPTLSLILKIIITILIQIFFIITFKNNYIKLIPFFISIIVFLYGFIINIRYTILFNKFLVLDLLNFGLYLIVSSVIVIIYNLFKKLKNN